jgi:glutaredoxin
MLLIVDGENFRHQIARVLAHHGKVRDNNDFFEFDFVGFCRHALHRQDVDIIYVTTRIKHPHFEIPESLHQLIDEIANSHGRWVEHLTEQGVNVVTAGNLKVKESNACYHCGKRTQTLQEKGVDVRVATELLLAAQRQVPEIVLGSSDSDMIPALDAARGLGAATKYVCHHDELNEHIQAAVSDVMTFDDGDVMQFFRQ